jgi:Glycosyl hydrolases family 16
MRRLGLLAAAVVTVLGAACSSASVGTGSFTWDGLAWCPTYQGAPCAGDSAPQVSIDGRGHLDLSLAWPANAVVSTAGREAFGTGQVFTAVITLPCTAARQIENWPAFWLDGTTGTWPAHGEIDVMEGLRGHAAWHYHYLNAAGEDAQIGATVPGNWCGTHTYAVDRGSSELRFYYDGHLAGRVTAAEIGVPLASDPMCIRVDYDHPGLYGGPAVLPAIMHVAQVGVTGA